MVTRNTAPSVGKLRKAEVKPNLSSPESKSWFNYSEKGVAVFFIPWHAFIIAAMVVISRSWVLLLERVPDGGFSLDYKRLVVIR